MGAATSVVPKGEVEDANEYDKDSDKKVIEELYECTQGERWHNSSGWGTGAHIKSWYGVTVDAEDRITALELRNNDLVGYIPRSIGRLKKLRRLLLGNNNNLIGSIPREICFLRELRHLDLHNCNGLSGEVPQNIGDNLIKLNCLSFHNCHLLKGQLPASFGNLVELEELDLYNCYGLTGGVPDSFSRLAKLSRLVLRSGQVCSVTGHASDPHNIFFTDAGCHVLSQKQTKDSCIIYDPQEIDEIARIKDELKWRRAVIDGEKSRMADFIDTQIRRREANLASRGYHTKTFMPPSTIENSSLALERDAASVSDISETETNSIVEMPIKPVAVNKGIQIHQYSQR